MMTDDDDSDSGMQSDFWQPDSPESAKSGTNPTSSASAAAGSAVPTQKRRRVTRACDECRRKKIKCDGKAPCTHCVIYTYGELVEAEVEVAVVGGARPHDALPYSLGASLAWTGYLYACILPHYKHRIELRASARSSPIAQAKGQSINIFSYMVSHSR